MSKKEINKKVAEGKKAARVAKKIGDKNKISKEAKKLSDKAVLAIAADLPAGQGNTFVKLHIEHGKAEAACAAAAKWKRDVRSSMKGIKIDMDAYNRVNKLSKMDPNDVTAKKTTEALYEKQLSMVTSEEQNELIDNVNKKREAARAAMSEIHGDDDAGKEVGSGNKAASNDEIDEVEEKLPERNEVLTSSFATAAAGTH